MIINNVYTSWNLFHENVAFHFIGKLFVHICKKRRTEFFKILYFWNEKLYINVVPVIDRYFEELKYIPTYITYIVKYF